MLVPTIFEQQAVAEVLGSRAQSTLCLLVGRQRDLDRVVLKNAHGDMDFDGGWRYLGKATRPLTPQGILQGEGTPVVEPNIAESSQLTSKAGRERGPSHCL